MKKRKECLTCGGAGYFRVLAADGCGWEARYCKCPEGERQRAKAYPLARVLRAALGDS